MTDAAWSPRGARPQRVRAASSVAFRALMLRDLTVLRKNSGCSSPAR